MTLVTYSPNRLLNELSKEFDSMFGRNVKSRKENSECECAFAPRVDIVENKDDYLMHVEIPGMNREDIKVRVEDKVLTISGERKKSEDEKSNYVRQERIHGKFARSFTLADEIDTEKISADYKNGILTIKLAIAEKAKPKEIDVNIS